MRARVAAVVLAVTLVSGCAAQVPGTDAARARRGTATTTSPATTSASPPTVGELPLPSEPSVTPDPSPPPGPRRVARKGVSLLPPAGYDEVTKQVALPNLVMAFRGQPGGRHYVLVQATTTPVRDLATTVQQLQEDVSEQTKAHDGGEWAPDKVGRVRSEVFGEVRAYGFRVIGELSGARSVRMQWYVERQGSLYVVTSTAPTASSQASEEALGTLLTTWRWV